MSHASEPTMAAGFAALAEMPPDDTVPALYRSAVDESTLSPLSSSGDGRFAPVTEIHPAVARR
jgi:hypothetical protein